MSYSDKALDIASSLAQIRINHTQFRDALEGIGRVIQLGNRLQEPFGVSIVAPPGAGKSLVIECVQKNICDWNFLRPNSVLVASLKESPTVAQIQNDLLANFNYAITPRSTRQTNAVLYNVLINAIKQHDIRLIALDEYQHVFLARKDDVHASVNDWLKRLMTQARVPVLLVGTETLRGIEKADPQLSTRIAAIFNLAEFRNDADWRALLVAFANAAKDIDLSALPEKYATSMHKATEGIFRMLKKLIIEAAMVAVDAGARAVEKDHLKDGFHRVVGPGSSKVNPFAK